MSKFVMVVQSRPRQGRDAEFNEWYDTVHLPDILALPGVNTARRFDFADGMAGEPGLPHLAIYEIETDDVADVAAEMGRRATDGTIRHSDTLDAPASVLWFYKQREK